MTPERKYSFKGYVHIFGITADKGICFYTVADCLVWFTLFCVLARKYHIQVLAVCIMLNHFHIEARFPSKQAMSAMMRELNSRFAQQYNRYYRLSGPLFQERYGSALKIKDQRIKDNFVYICNNPVGKKAVRNAWQYRWNFLAYMDSDHPFSDALVIRRCSRNLLSARAEVLRCSRSGLPLGYLFFGGIYEGLTDVEKNQIVDWIVFTYNVIDYEVLRKVWGGYEQVCEMLSAVSGSEYDLADDDAIEDYRHYYQMIRIVLDSGFDIRRRRFTGLSYKEVRCLARRICDRIGVSRTELVKFLHNPLSELFDIQ